MIASLAFYVFAAILLASAGMVVSARNPVHSVLFLVLAFFNAAALFLLAGAEFLAMILVIVYVGAVGSRRTHSDRLDRLRDAGLTDAELARLHSPIGLDLGGRTPEETAVSIAAEIVAAHWGGGGQPLGHTTGPIHTAAFSGESAADS